jgi:uncharacterized protein (DUF1778 family)
MTANKETRLIIRCSEKEKALFEKAADVLGLSLSAFVRMAAIKHAQAVLRDHRPAALDAAKKEKGK